MGCRSRSVLAEYIGHGPKYGVARRMAVDVVHLLEEVDIHHHARERCSRPLDASPFLAERFVEDALRDQSGQVVGASQDAKAAFEVDDSCSGPDTCKKLVPLNRLAREIVGADFEPLDHFSACRSYRQEDRVDVLSQLEFPNLTAQLDAVHVGHFPVGDQKIGRGFLDRSNRLARIVERLHLIPGLLQPNREDPEHGRVVVDEHNFCVVRTHELCTGFQLNDDTHLRSRCSLAANPDRPTVCIHRGATAHGEQFPALSLTPLACGGPGTSYLPKP